MVNSEILDLEAEQLAAPVPNALQASESGLVQLGFDHPLRHSCVEPLICTALPDQRKYERLVIPHVVAYLGSAHASRPRQVANISVGGFCMLTDEEWTHGSEMPITLQREEWDGEESSERISIRAVVTRRGHGQVGFSIALTPEEFIALSVDSASGRWISKTRMEEFLEKLRKPKAPRLLLFDYSLQRPLSFTERTERLLEFGRLHRLLPALEPRFEQTELSASPSPENHPQGGTKRKPQKNRPKRKRRGKEAKPGSISSAGPCPETPESCT